MNMPSPGDQQEWTPYTPPPPDRGEQIWVALRRYSFPVLVLIFIVGLGAALYWESNSTTAADQEEARLQAAIEAYRSGETPAGQGGVDPLGSTSSAGSSSTAEGQGAITVRSQPSQATVRVDDDSVGVTPLAGHPLEPGVYFIAVERDGYVTADTLLIVRSDNAPSFTAVLQRDVGGNRRTSPSRSVQPQRSTPPAESSPARSSSNESVVSPPQVPSEDVSPSEQGGAPAPEVGSVQFVTEPSDATVLLDGERKGTTPLTLSAIPAGSHRATLYRSGYDTVRTQVEIAPGTQQVIRQTLTPLPGRLRVLVQPWGSVYVDGSIRQRNTDVWFETTLPAGTHEVAAVHPALGRQTRSVQIAPGAEQSVVIDLRSQPETETDSTAQGEGNSNS